MSSFTEGIVEHAGIGTHKLPSGTATLDFEFDGQVDQSSATFANGLATGSKTVGVEVIHIDAASSLPLAQQHFCKFENSSELTNGVGAKILEAKELADLNYLAKRQYDEVRLYEVEGENHDLLPHGLAEHRMMLPESLKLSVKHLSNFVFVLRAGVSLVRSHKEPRIG